MADSKQITAYRTVIEEGFNKGNLSVLDKYIASNVKEHELGIDPPTLEGLKQGVQSWRTAFPDLRFTVDDIWESGDKVIARFHYTGTHKGPMGDIPPTGKKINVEGFDVVRFSGDKCVEHWGMSDRMTMMEQLGLVPATHQM